MTTIRAKTGHIASDHYTFTLLAVFFIIFPLASLRSTCKRARFDAALMGSEMAKKITSSSF